MPLPHMIRGRGRFEDIGCVHIHQENACGNSGTMPPGHLEILEAITMRRDSCPYRDALTWGFLAVGGLMALGAAGDHGRVFGQEPSNIHSTAERESTQVLDSLLTRLMTAAERVTMGGRMGTAGDSLPDVADLCRAARRLEAESAADRNTRIKDWMFPASANAPLRNAQCFVPAEFPPEWFFLPNVVAQPIDSESVADQTPAWNSDGVISFLEMLVQAAADTSQLDELTRLAEAKADRCEIARSLARLAAFALARSKNETPDASALRTELHQATAAPGNARVKLWPVYLLARAMCRDDAYRSAGIEVLDELLSVSDSVPLRPLQSHCVRDRAVARIALTGGHVEPASDPQLQLWQPGGYYFHAGSQAGTWPAWWVEHAGVILSAAGPEVSTLQFACPLTGSFELTANMSRDAGAEPAVQFGRVTFYPCVGLDKAVVRSIGEQETVPRKVEPEPAGTSARIRIVATAENVRFYREDALLFEDAAPSSTTPWLVLVSRSPRACAWTDLKISGSPQSPREVRLIEDDRMEGWMSPLYRERLPRQFASKLVDSGAMALERPQDSSGDWSVVQGELIGKALGAAASKIISQSWLAYHRTLQPGDALSYEFYYEPGKAIVWPSLGRTAFLVEPAGVRLHWITDIPHMAVGGLTPDNAVIDPRSRPDRAGIPLRPNNWNSMVVTISDQTARLSLNGTDIYAHPLAAADSRLFGFFHYRSHSQARVRAVVLRGNWLSTLSPEELSQPFARRGEWILTPEMRKGLETLMDEPWLPRPTNRSDDRQDG